MLNFDMDYVKKGISEKFEKAHKEKIYENITIEEMMLKNREGIGLHTLICKPQTTSTISCIVERTCYPALMNIGKIIGEEFSKRGFAYILQMSRGMGKSEGVWEPNINERNDGIDLLKYLEEEAWVENIGLLGNSYSALAAWSMADSLSSKVKSMYLSMYGCDRFTSAYSNGLFRHDVLTGWTMNNSGIEIKADYIESCKFMPHISVDETLWKVKLDWYRQWISHPSKDDDYWTEGFWGMLAQIPSKVDIPVFILEGWFDHHLASAVNTYEKLPDTTKKKSILKIGPWNHLINNSIDSCKSSAVNMEYNEYFEKLNWFEKTLKKMEIPDGIIEYYNIGEDSWKKTKAYPLKNHSGRKYSLSSEKAQNSLILSNRGSGKIIYKYDPLNPVSSIGAESMLTTFGQLGSKIQPEKNYREDVLSFETSPLEMNMDIIGEIGINLRVKSSAEDTSFCVKIMDVTEAGDAYNIRTVIGTLGYRNGKNIYEEYQAENYVDLTLKSWPISWRINKGHKIRIDITSTDFPQYSVHPNRRELWCLVESPTVATQTIDCTYSYIEFPG